MELPLDKIKYDEIEDYYKQFKERYVEFKEPPVIINEEEIKQYNEQFGKLYTQDFNNGCEINVWEVSGLKRDEVRNCTTLAWWFDCNGSHGLGARLLDQVIKTYIPDFDKKLDGLSYSSKTEISPSGIRDNRIDITISSRDFLLFWEVKIDAPEGKDQLKGYSRVLEGLSKEKYKKLIYLTCAPQPETDDKIDKIVYITWKQISNCFEKVEKQLESSCLAKPILKQYCQFIKDF